MTLKTTPQLKRALARIGASLDESQHNTDTFIMDAPPGSVWVANGAHCYVVPYANWGGQSWRPEALKDAAEIITMGVQPCDTPDCDVCEERKPVWA